MIPSREEWMQALCRRQGPELQKRFASATVAVCGLGGLGSHIALALARSGVGKLILIDFDRVDITNLHRQQYNARQIGMYKTEALAENIRAAAPYGELVTVNRRMNGEDGAPLLQGAEVVCEAFDDPAAKAALVNDVLEHMPETYVVAASGMAGLGSPNALHTRRMGKRLYLCGDEVSAVEEDMGLMASRVMLCAAHQAHTVLRILAGEYDV